MSRVVAAIMAFLLCGGVVLIAHGVVDDSFWLLGGGAIVLGIYVGLRDV